MILIGETAKCLLGHSVQRCVKSRRWVCAHARNHVICQSCPKCLIAVVLVDVDLPYWTSNVEHVVAFTVIFSNICTARAQKRLFMNFSVNLDIAIWFADPDFLLECTKFQRFGDVSRWFFWFYMLNVRHISTSGLFELLTQKVHHTRRPPHR